jgi:hypothetical protein
MNGLLTTREVARRLKVTPARVSQIVRDLRRHLGPIQTVGRNQLFTAEQLGIIRNRETKPGPKGRGSR